MNDVEFKRILRRIMLLKYERLLSKLYDQDMSLRNNLDKYIERIKNYQLDA